MEPTLVAVMIYLVASAVLLTRTPFRFKKTPVIIVRALAFAVVYSLAGLLIWSVGYPLVGVISWLGGMLLLAGRMFRDAMAW